jgi:hypothetical protein
MDTFVRRGGPISARASAVHHLVDEDVKNAPTLTVVIRQFTGANFYVVRNAELSGASSPPRALGRPSPFPGFERAAISPHRAAIRRDHHSRGLRGTHQARLERTRAEPALHTRFHFAKYRGKRYAEIAASDPDYLRSFVEKSELEGRIKHSARYWLGITRHARAND